MKRFVSLLLVIAFCLPFCVIPVGAVVDDDTEISFEYFYTTLQQEYQKYGMDLTIENPGTDLTYTMGGLKQELEWAKKFCEGIQICIEDIPIPTYQGGVATASIPANYSYGKRVSIWSEDLASMGYVHVYVYCSGKVDLQNAAVISYSGSMYEENSMNLLENNLTLNTSLSSTGKEVRIVLSGNVKFSWTGVHSNLVFTSNRYGPFLDETINPHDYLV